VDEHCELRRREKGRLNLSTAEVAVREDKQGIRRAMAARRAALLEAEVRTLSAKLCERVEAELAGLCARTVASFAAIRNEVDLAPLLAPLRARGVCVAYPKVATGGRLSFHAVQSESELSPTGSFQIPEPSPSAMVVAPEAFDAVLVPGLAFDPSGYRLGWGGGYYDATLPLLTAARRIGVCFDFQLIAACPHGTTDESVHIVITESRVIQAVPPKEASP
jgi:5-formyltetrahydrofolate cyclo-ligase